MACDHSASHSGGARFLRKAGKLQLLLVCDTCGAERARLGRIEYRPDPRRLVVQVAEQIARELGLAAAQTEKVRFAALVCGLARNRIDPAILRRRGPLSEAEWVQMRRQPELAAALLSDASMDDVREWVLCHRERPDGSGYPRGLVGGQIPLEARIIAVADAYAAMLSRRPYRRARRHDAACRELLRCADAQFDPTVVEAFLRASHARELRFALPTLT
jgi:HD-GYP domain-containing protein (c-di-GMP phosphodiesterase class II)